MTKAQLVKNVAKATGIDGKTIEYVVDHTTESIKSAVIAGDNVAIRSFGTFCRQYRKAKIGRIIKDNCAVEIPAHYVTRFKPAKEFSDAVKDGGNGL